MQDSAGGDIHLLLSILADGEEQARQLLGDGGQCYYTRTAEEEEHCSGVARQLLGTFVKAIAVAKTIEAAGASGSRGTGGDRSDSPRSADESSGRTATREPQERQGDMSKRRKGLPRWTEKIRMPDSNLEVTPDDGFSWRKYGQKDILGAKFPRSYYRCTYRNAQGCHATKQVQRSDADLCVFDVTYQGAHACHQKQRHTTPPPPLQAQDPEDMQLLMSFKDSLKVEAEGLGAMTASASGASFHHGVGYCTGAPFSFPSVAFHAGMSPPDNAAAAAFSPVEHGQLGGGGFSSPAFASPAASGASSSYFSMAHLSELGEVVSAATTSSTVDHSAAAGYDYSLYHHAGEVDPHLPFPPMFGPSHGQYR